MKHTLKAELEKAENLLAKTKNLNEKTFYEGYIKGLKFLGDNQLKAYMLMKKNGEPVTDSYTGVYVATIKKNLPKEKGEYIQEVIINWTSK